jgi:predicted CoA-binding protein
MKKTLVVGASTNPDRYAYRAIHALRQAGHEVIAFGQRPGTDLDVPIETNWHENWEVDTVTLYVGPANSFPLRERIIALRPQRVIFNPGTEDADFIQQVRAAGIEAEIACTLVLLSLGAY